MDNDGADCLHCEKPVVPYVSGRKKALARALALEIAKAEGVKWATLSMTDKSRRVQCAVDVVSQWVAAEVVTQFFYEWRG